MKKTPSNTKRVRVNHHLRSNISDKLMDIQVKVRDGLRVVLEAYQDLQKAQRLIYGGA